MSMVVKVYCTWDLGGRGDKENTYGAFLSPDLVMHSGGGGDGVDVVSVVTSVISNCFSV